MHKIFVITSLTAGFLVSHLQAQPAPTSKTPAEPFTRNMPERSQWTLEFAPGPKGSAPSEPEPKTNERPLVQSIQFTKVGNVRHDLVRWSNGKTTEAWKMGSIYAAEQLQTEHILLSHEKYSLSTFDLGATDFSELAWIDARHFTGIKEFRGEACYEFVDDELRFEIVPGVFTKVPVAQAAESATPSEKPNSPAGGALSTVFPIEATKRSVLISVERGLPVMFVSDGRTGIYQWQAVPTAELKPPERFVAPIKIWEEKLSSSMKRPSKP